MFGLVYYLLSVVWLDGNFNIDRLFFHAKSRTHSITSSPPRQSAVSVDMPLLRIGVNVISFYGRL